MAEEEGILDEEHVHEELAVKYETGDEDGAEKITMLPADVNVGTRRKVPLKERLSLTLHLLKLLTFYLLRPSLLISLSYFGLMLIPLITLHALSYNKHHLLEGCYILSFINISGVSILVSMIVACNYKMLKHRIASSNIILQKTFIIWFLYCMMLTGLWMNCSLIFKFAVRNDQEYVNVAKNIEYFCFLFTPGLFFLGVSLLLQSYMLLVKDGTACPIVLSNWFTVFLNVLLNWILPKEGVRSGAIAADLSFACLAVFLFLWVIWDDDYRCSWTGLSWAALCDWAEVLKPMLICLCIVIAEWWVFDVVTILIGPYRTDWVVSHAVNVYIIEAIFVLFTCFAAGTSVQALEAMDASYYRRGIFIIKASLFIMWTTALVIGGILALSQEAIVKIFAKDLDTWSVEKTLSIVAILPYLKVSQTLGFHIKRRISQSSFVFLMSCQLILGFPLGMCLLFFSDRGIYGIWVGYIIGMFVQMVYFLSGLYSYVQEFSISKNYPKWKESLYSQDDVEDFDGKRQGVTSLLLRYSQMHMRFNSIDILCSHSIDSGLENQVYAFGDSLKDVEVKTIFWRFVNLFCAVLIFVIGFFVKYR